MSELRTIVGVAHDPGGARAILPVLDLLRIEGEDVLAFMAGPAVSICEKEFPDMKMVTLEDGLTLEECRQMLVVSKTKVLVSASGLYNQIEHTMRLVAKKCGVPIVAVLDWWFHYKERFQRRYSDHSVVESVPDQICALDETTRNDLIEEGFSEESIVVTGAANLESSWKRIQNYSKRAEEFRRELGVLDTEKCAVFFSEPYIRASDGLPWGGLGGYYREDGTTVTGYTPHEMLREIALALAQEKPSSASLVLLVKAHPMEDIPSLRVAMSECESSGIRLVLVDTMDPAKLCAVGDIFFGMVSVVLIEAALSGKPVFSVQIVNAPIPPEDCNMGNRLGFTRPVYDRATLEDGIAQWFGGSLLGSKGTGKITFDGAARNIVKTINLVTCR